MKEFVIKYFNEFKVKKGNIISYKQNNCNNYITLIVNEVVSDGIIAYAGLNYKQELDFKCNYGIENITEVRLANQDEINELNEKLSFNNLKWNADKREFEHIVCNKYLDLLVLKVGDMAICWNKNLHKAVIAEITNIVPEDTHPYYACLTKYYKNAIKWNGSIETYKNFIRYEILD